MIACYYITLQALKSLQLKQLIVQHAEGLFHYSASLQEVLHTVSIP